MENLFHRLIDWFIDWFIDWLIDWLIECFPAFAWTLADLSWMFFPLCLIRSFSTSFLVCRMEFFSVMGPILAPLWSSDKCLSLRRTGRGCPKMLPIRHRHCPLLTLLRGEDEKGCYVNYSLTRAALPRTAYIFWLVGFSRVFTECVYSEDQCVFTRGSGGWALFFSGQCVSQKTSLHFWGLPGHWESGAWCHISFNGQSSTHQGWIMCSTSIDWLTRYDVIDQLDVID